ncbi:MAG: hypothetical protein IH782_12390 [candidate division NC10 bacterium]|nr:hypothetical protein [candidate division NC10 bacterium]
MAIVSFGGCGGCGGRAGLGPESAEGVGERCSDGGELKSERKGVQLVRKTRPVIRISQANTRFRPTRSSLVFRRGRLFGTQAPERFVEVLSDFVETTVPARITVAAHQALRQTGS